MRKVPFGILKAKQLNFQIVGFGLSKKAIAALKRFVRLGVTLYGSSALISELKMHSIPMKAFTDDIAGATIGFPQSGLPAIMSEALTATKDSHLAKLAEANKPVIHGVLSEFELVMTSEVENVVTYNITDALAKAYDGGRITTTRVAQWEQILDVLEKTNELTEETYEALAVCNGVSTWTAVQNYSESVVNDLQPQFETSKEVLSNLGIEVEEVA